MTYQPHHSEDPSMKPVSMSGRTVRPSLICSLALPLIDELARLDPAPDTPEGKLFIALAAGLEEYEKARFHVGRSPLEKSSSWIMRDLPR